jgi:cytochrome c oxidase assembly protein subunit 15
MNNLFNLLVKTSLVLIYLVIIAGAIVRMTGSGMGCPDWPKCFGYLIPPTEKSELIFSSFHDYNKGEMIILNSEKLYSATNDFKSNEAIDLNNWSLFEKHDYVVYDPLHTWVEYINRLIGALAGIPILLFTLISIYYWRDYKYLTLISILTVLGMGFQAWLGKTVVDSNLAPYKITIHMLMALVIVGLILSLIIHTKKSKSVNNKLFKNLIIFSITLTLIQGATFAWEFGDGTTA